MQKYEKEKYALDIILPYIVSILMDIECANEISVDQQYLKMKYHRLQGYTELMPDIIGYEIDCTSSNFCNVPISKNPTAYFYKKDKKDNDKVKSFCLYKDYKLCCTSKDLIEMMEHDNMPAADYTSECTVAQNGKNCTTTTITSDGAIVINLK